MRATRLVLVSLVVLALVAGLSFVGSATTAAVKTTSGRVLQGALAGLAPMLRLEDPTPSVGPAAQFNIPLDSIQQMWIDFPRVVIETAEHVIVGPYSAFAGIAQLLKIGEGSAATEVPFTAIEAIAFNGASFQPLPREWFSRGWFNRVPNVVRKPIETIAGTAAAVAPVVAPVMAPVVAPVTPAVAAPTAIEETVSASEDIVGNGVTPEAAAPTSGGAFPWWTALALVAVMIAVFLFFPTSIL